MSVQIHELLYEEITPQLLVYLVASELYIIFCYIIINMCYAEWDCAVLHVDHVS